jgi:hypothetical protein
MKKNRRPNHMRYLVWFLFSFLLFALFGKTEAQTISGIVLNGENKQIIGANVSIKGTTKATQQILPGTSALMVLPMRSLL